MPAANPEKGEFGIEIGGRPYVLAMDFNGFIDLQGLFTKGDVVPSVDSLMDRAQKGDLAVMRGVFWATLRRHHPEITVQQAGDLINEAGGLAKVNALIDGAALAAAPDKRDVAALGGADTRPPKARRGTGGRSISPGGAAA